MKKKIVGNWRLKRLLEALDKPVSYEKEYNSYDDTEDFERY